MSKRFDGTQRTVFFALATISLLFALSCSSSAQVTDEVKLIEVVGGEAYVCLTNAVNDSDPQSCGGAAIGSARNPQLRGDLVHALVADLGGRTGWATVTAAESDEGWTLEAYDLMET